MEKRYWLWLFIISLTICLGLLVGYFYAHSHFSDLETRLQMLESQYAASLKPGQELKLDEVKILIAKSEEAVKEKSFLLTTIGLPFTIIALLTSIFGAFRWAAEIAKEKAMEVFKDPETILKESKKILVLTGDLADEAWMRKFLFAMSFPNVDFKKEKELDDVKTFYDLIIINAPNDSTGKNDLIEKITVAKSVFYFGKGRATNASLDAEGRLSFANAKSQLYGNLINALKFQKML